MCSRVAVWARGQGRGSVRGPMQIFVLPLLLVSATVVVAYFSFVVAVGWERVGGFRYLTWSDLVLDARLMLPGGVPIAVIMVGLAYPIAIVVYSELGGLALGVTWFASTAVACATLAYLAVRPTFILTLLAVPLVSASLAGLLIGRILIRRGKQKPTHRAGEN